MRNSKLSFIVHLLSIVILSGLIFSTISNVYSQTSESETIRQYLIRSTPENVIWGKLFTADSQPILTVKSGEIVTIETISHEGILDDQGDTVEFFTQAGIDKADILPDQLAVKEQIERTAPGPHVITGPVYIEDAEPGDVQVIMAVI
jgi:hypothetical protein